jgi:hypothetical protein
MTFSPAPTNPTSTFSVRGLTRKSSGEVFVTLSNGELYASAAGNETLVRVPNLPAQTGSTLLGPIVAFGNDVALFRGASLQTCSGACTDFNSFNPLQSLQFPEEAMAFCARGDGTSAYLTSNAGSTGKLSVLQRGMTLTLNEVSANVGIGNVEKCQVSSTGDVLIAGDTGVGVLRAAGGIVTETVDLMGQPGAGWRDVAGTFLVGGGSGYRVALRSMGVWTSVAPDTSGTLLSSVASLSATETLAGGIVNSGNTTQAGILKWNGSRFVGLTPAAPVFEVEHALTVSENEVYFAGYERATGGYVIVHGTR